LFGLRIFEDPEGTLQDMFMMVLDTYPLRRHIYGANIRIILCINMALSLMEISNRLSRKALALITKSWWDLEQQTM